MEINVWSWDLKHKISYFKAITTSLVGIRSSLVCFSRTLKVSRLLTNFKTVYSKGFLLFHKALILCLRQNICKKNEQKTNKIERKKT